MSNKDNKANGHGKVVIRSTWKKININTSMT